MYCIYGLKTDRIRYVGITLERRREKRAYEHRYYNTIDTADFEFVILFKHIPSVDEANEMEKVFIDIYKTFRDDGYGGFNLTRGGGRSTEHSIETRLKISKGMTGRIVTQETRDRISKSHTGKVISKEQRKQISEKLTARKIPQNVRDKISDSLKGRVKTKEHQDKITESLKGKKVPQDRRIRISESLRTNSMNALTRKRKQRYYAKEQLKLF